MQASFIISAFSKEQFPPEDKAEVCLIGRSNSGKSTLINTLLQRKNLARMSSKPGSTQGINFYDAELGERQVVVADLPGYGYSKSKKTISKSWESLTNDYLSREALTKGLFLIDIRREVTEHEVRFLKSLLPVAEIAIVLTKTDKLNLSQNAKEKQKKLDFFKKNDLGGFKVFTVSALRKKGVESLKEFLFDI